MAKVLSILNAHLKAPVGVVIYTIVQQCDDPFYPDNPIGIAFRTEAEAVEYCNRHNESYEDYPCSVVQCDLR